MNRALLTTTCLASFLLASPVAAEQTMSMKEIQQQLKLLTQQVDQLSKIVEKQNDVIQRQEEELAQQADKTRAVQEAQKEAQDAIKASAATFPQISPAAGHAAGSNLGNASGDQGVKISMDPSPKIESTDGHYSAALFGRVHMDATFFDDDASDNPDNTNIRRARIGLKGKLGEDFKYKSEFDFAEDAADIEDLTLTYTGFNATDITIGHFRPSFGLERNTSSNNTSFVERAGPTNLFTQDRSIGINFTTKQDHWSFGIGAFGEDAGNSNPTDDEDHSIVARASANLLGLADKDSKNVLHIGAGYNYQNPNGTVEYSARPGTAEGPDLIDTGDIASVEDIDNYGAELAGVFGPVHFQAEYFDTTLSRNGGNVDVDFNGYYGQIGYFITGERRNYDGKSGVFKNTAPLAPFSMKDGGAGAWEILFRYENNDLNDQNAGILGGEMETYAVGVNWYVTDHVRFLANIIAVDTDENASTEPNDDPTVYNIRAQWDF